jgi:hypothetical protein
VQIPVMVGVLVLLLPFALGRERHPLAPEPSGFEVARVTHFDFGPPMNYYELYLVRSTATGSSIERVTLTPPGGSCLQSAKVEDKIATVSQTVRALLGEKNPCSIPEKDVHRVLAFLTRTGSTRTPILRQIRHGPCDSSTDSTMRWGRR